MLRRLPTLAILVGAAAHAQNFEGSVERYQSEANYGPEIAVLGEAYERDGKLELSLGGSYSPFSSLVRHYAATGSLTFHLARRHAIEPIWFSQHFSSLGAFARKEFRDNSNVGNKTVSTLEAPKQSFAASYFYHPYYAKMHITERTVTHFDVLLGLGMGLVRTESLFLDGASTNAAIQNRMGGVATVGLRFLFPSRFALRTELRDFIYQGENLGKKSLQHSLNLSLTASIFFGAFPD